VFSVATETNNKRENPMSKLLNTYRAAPTFKNAQKIRAYERKHMMAVVCLPKEDQDLVATAIHHANTPQ
jgi:hypothetical protein